MKVLKFGGSSLADVQLINEVAKNIKNKLEKEKKLIIVASAMGKTTNDLIAKMQKTSKEINKRELDQLLSTGEIQSISLLANSLCDLGVKAKSLAGWQAGIITNSVHTDAEIKKIEKIKLDKELEESDVLLIAGFQGVHNGEVTTLGRGGSDTSAVALAALYGCPCEIYTDVDGVYSIDPKIKSNAKKFSEISYDEMITMAFSGAKVLEKRCSMLAKEKNVDLYIGKSLEEHHCGTKVVSEVSHVKTQPISSIAVRTNLGIVKLLAHSPKELKYINETLSNLQCEKISCKSFNNCAVISAYFDKGVLKEINSNFQNITKKISLDYSKISLIGCDTDENKKQVMRQIKRLEHSKIVPKTLKEGENYISFAVSENNDLAIAKNLSNSFEI